MEVEKERAGELGKDLRHQLPSPPFTDKETRTYRGKGSHPKLHSRIGEEVCFSYTSPFAVIQEGVLTEHLLCAQSCTKLHGGPERSSKMWFPV